MAFQLSDDIMDVISTEAELKKEPGQDLREGVYTLPILYALKEGDRREGARQPAGGWRAPGASGGAGPWTSSGSTGPWPTPDRP